MRTRRFRYIFDPLCVGAIGLFAVNRWILKPMGIVPWFTHGYVNDLLCLPIFLPVSLGLQRLLRVRPHDRPPRSWELAQHWAIFSIVFELVLPHVDGFRSTGDPLDVLAYFIGGAVAGCAWHLVDQRSFPFDRRRRLRRDVIDDTVHAPHLVDDA